MSQSSTFSWLLDSQDDGLFPMVDDADVDSDVSETYWSDEDDAWCHTVDLDPPSFQEGGGLSSQQDDDPLFDFTLQPTHLPRRWRNVVNKSRFRARLSQRRAPTTQDNLGGELVDAMRRAVNMALASQSLQPRDHIHFTLQSDAFAATQNCFQSTHFTRQEIDNHTPRFDMYLNSLATQLNSSQSFQLDDDFTLDVTTIAMPSAGTGKRKCNPVEATVRHVVKKSHVLVRNTDALCCARAIVTMRAWTDEQPPRFTPPHSYRTLKQGGPVQTQLACELHELAQVPEGACGLEELQKFQDALPDYQIKVLRLGPPHMIVFAGPDIPTNKRIILIQDGDHFDGCTSLTGFLNRSFFCHACNKGYNEETYRHHRCNKTYCSSCLTFDCVDFLNILAPNQPFPKPTVTCTICHRHFYGQVCLARHLTTSNTAPFKSTCQSVIYCTSCCKTTHLQFTRSGQRKGKRHKCGWVECEQCESLSNLTHTNVSYNL